MSSTLSVHLVDGTMMPKDHACFVRLYYACRPHPGAEEVAGAKCRSRVMPVVKGAAGTSTLRSAAPEGHSTRLCDNGFVDEPRRGGGWRLGQHGRRLIRFRAASLLRFAGGVGGAGVRNSTPGSVSDTILRG